MRSRPSTRVRLSIRCLLSAATLLMALVGRNSALAQDDASQSSDASRLAADYVELFESKIRSDAELRFLTAEKDRLVGGTGGFDTGFLTMLANPPSASEKTLVSFLERTGEPVATSLGTLRSGVEADLARLRASWLDIRTRVNRARLTLFEVTARRQVAGQIASIFNVDNRWLWLCGVVAIGGLIAVILFEIRHRLRRLLGVQRARAWGLLLLLSLLFAVPLLPTLLTFLLGNQTYDSLIALAAAGGDAPKKRLTAEIDALRTEASALGQSREKTEREYADALARKESSIASPAGERSAVTAQWEGSRQQLREAFVRLEVESGLSTALAADLAELKKLDESLLQNAESISQLRRFKHLTGAGIGIVLLATTGLGTVLLLQNVKHRQVRIDNTCPRCLAEGTLERKLPEGAGTRRRPELEQLHCTNVIKEDPYEECGYTFMANYRDRVKLAFPTLGVASSGKTHWLTMVYRELNQGRFPEYVHFEKVKSEGSAEFDEKVDWILNNRMSTKATLANRLPHPLVFSFRDHDRFGNSHALVNIFDYAGQITATGRLEDFHRRRALDGDGFFFFLDPTAPSEHQADALVNFREDLRLLKNLKAGKQIHTPVALCVTKLDLLVNQPYAEGGDVISGFYEELSRIDPTGQGMRLDVIEKRSRLIGELRDTIWPGWQIERQIRGLFGNRFMFFPCTPVGLNELGETDLTRRTIAPYGILEPLLWLLHMNGFPVLK